LSIHEIAARLGFRNPSHFFVLFKKYVGVSPLQYRKSLNSKP
jgi:AraC-like DNA-binding protein